MRLDPKAHSGLACPSPSPILEDGMHPMTLANQLAPTQKSKSSGNDSMTADFYKSIYQKTYLPNDFRLMILGNKKVLEKSQIG